MLLPQKIWPIVAMLAVVQLFSGSEIVVIPMWCLWLRNLAKSHRDGSILGIPQVNNEATAAFMLAGLACIAVFAISAWSPEGMVWHDLRGDTEFLAFITIVLLTTPPVLASILVGVLISIFVIISVGLTLAEVMHVDMSLLSGVHVELEATGVWALVSVCAWVAMACLVWMRWLDCGWKSPTSDYAPLILHLFSASEDLKQGTQRTSWAMQLHGWRKDIAAPAGRYAIAIRALKGLRIYRSLFFFGYKIAVLWFWFHYQHLAFLTIFALLWLPEWTLMGVMIVRLKMVGAGKGATSELVAMLPASMAPNVWRRLAMKEHTGVFVMFAVLLSMFFYHVWTWI